MRQPIHVHTLKRESCAPRLRPQFYCAHATEHAETHRTNTSAHVHVRMLSTTLQCTKPTGRLQRSMSAHQKHAPNPHTVHMIIRKHSANSTARPSYLHTKKIHITHTCKLSGEDPAHRTPTYKSTARHNKYKFTSRQRYLQRVFASNPLHQYRKHRANWSQAYPGQLPIQLICNESIQAYKRRQGSPMHYTSRPISTLIRTRNNSSPNSQNLLLTISV